MVTTGKESRQQHRQTKRRLKKASLAIEKSENQVVMKIKQLLKQVLVKEFLDEIAKRTGFSKRKREVSAFAIIAVLMMGCSVSEDIASLERMCIFLQKWFGIAIKPQSLQARLNNKKTMDFVKEITTKIMIVEANKVIARLIKSQRLQKTNLFARILLQDSTVISLPETVARIFKGCGGAASKAAVKCDLVFDQRSHLIVRIKCVAGKIPDASLSGDILSFVEENDLVIRDLGYFNLAHFVMMASKNVRFISRLSKSVNIYINKFDNNPVDIIKYLNELNIKHKGIDIDVYIGKIERMPVRLIGVKVPPEVVNARRQQYKLARGSRAEPSEALHEWNGYTLMITNIPREQVSMKSIFNLYKIRWQIELFFKNMKSYLCVDRLSGKNKYRILCLVYTKLALTWLTAILFALAQAIISQGKEISQFKFTRWLKEIFGFQNLFATWDFTELLKELGQNIHLLCKRSKKRKTSLKSIQNAESNGGGNKKAA